MRKTNSGTSVVTCIIVNPGRVWFHHAIAPWYFTLWERIMGPRTGVDAAGGGLERFFEVPKFFRIFLLFWLFFYFFFTFFTFLTFFLLFVLFGVDVTFSHTICNKMHTCLIIIPPLRLHPSWLSISYLTFLISHMLLFRLGRRLGRLSSR